MRVNDDGRTVAAMDVLAPGIGEIIGGSQREERLDVLDARIAERGIDKAHYAWYRDLRRYGTVPHAGFGLGFKRILAYVTGLSNVRDAIPFPRTPGMPELSQRFNGLVSLSALAGTLPTKLWSTKFHLDRCHSLPTHFACDLAVAMNSFCRQRLGGEGCRAPELTSESVKGIATCLVLCGPTVARSDPLHPCNVRRA